MQQTGSEDLQVRAPAGRGAARRRAAGRFRWGGGGVVLAAGLVLAGPGAARELNTDRPDATESPFTVEPGRWQVELEAVSWTRDRADGWRTTEWVWAPFNLRVGVTLRLEAGVVLVPHVRRTVRAPGGGSVTQRGWGDTTARAKWNLAGNDGGGWAAGVIADLQLPTATDGLGSERLGGALALPVAFEIGGGWEGGAMTGVEVRPTKAGRRAVWMNTLTVARDLAPQWGGFVELTSVAGDGSHAATVNCGLTRRIGADRQLDAGVNVGLSRAADDLTVFAGVSQRF